jgi:hypothetical protein
MCRRSEALDAQIEAARCLSAACATRIGTTAALREIYERDAAEPVPPPFAELLARLGPDEGGRA